jgi:hypothetical protein
MTPVILSLPSTFFFFFENRSSNVICRKKKTVNKDHKARTDCSSAVRTLASRHVHQKPRHDSDLHLFEHYSVVVRK